MTVTATPMNTIPLDALRAATTPAAAHVLLIEHFVTVYEATNGRHYIHDPELPAANVDPIRAEIRRVQALAMEAAPLVAELIGYKPGHIVSPFAESEACALLCHLRRMGLYEHGEIFGDFRRVWNAGKRKLYRQLVHIDAPGEWKGRR